MKSKFLITGPPGCGKTTLIKKIARSVNKPAYGFYTGELKEQGTRVGFSIASLQGDRAIMSHIDIKSPYKVGKYGVDLEAFEAIAIPQLESALQSKKLTLIDEIGKMELHSSRFKELVEKIIDSDIPLVATIMAKPNRFCDRLKRSPGVELLLLSRQDHEKVFNRIVARL